MLLLNNSPHERISNLDWSRVFRRGGRYRSVNPRPPVRTGTPRRSRSTLVTVLSVTAGMRTSFIARSSGFSNSAISGNVLRKNVQRCSRPNRKWRLRSLLEAVIWRTLRVHSPIRLLSPQHIPWAAFLIRCSCRLYALSSYHIIIIIIVIIIIIIIYFFFNLWIKFCIKINDNNNNYYFSIEIKCLLLIERNNVNSAWTE